MMRFRPCGRHTEQLQRDVEDAARKDGTFVGLKVKTDKGWLSVTAATNEDARLRMINLMTELEARALS